MAVFKRASFILLCLLAAIVYGKQYTLNVPRVLLPHVPLSGVKSNFTLRSEYGCFSWVSTKPDIATVQPVYMTTKNGLKCSREAVLTPLSTEPVRLSTIIIATEEATGLTLRSDVYVDTISRIEITTRTRELLLEEEPEKFEVRAFDDEGNMFSTVRGHVFEWTLLKDEEAENQQLVPESILSFVQFKDSSYSVDNIISSIEQTGKQGDEVLVSGINTGTAKVRVKLAEKTWKAVGPDIVKLLVIENLMLLPSADVYIMPLSYVDYRVERRKHGKVEVVSMPSDQYTLELINTTVASLDRDKSRVTGMVIGSTELILHDKNMLNIPRATKPSADIHVVFPHHIELDVTPGHRWILQVGKEYIFMVHLLDKTNHRILITDNVQLVTNVPTGYFQLHHSSVNGSYHTVTASKAGKTSLVSSIKELKHPDTGELHPLPSPLTKSQLIEIFYPVKVEPPVLLLLWDSKNEHQYKHQLKASGGSGSYQWSSDNVDIVGVSPSGVLTSFSIGSADVTVSDIRNPDHYDIAKVHIVSPSDMKFLSSPVEVEVGGNLLLPLQVLGQTLTHPFLTLPFYDCRHMNFKYSLEDDAIFNISINSNIKLSSLPAGSCTLINASSLKPGHTKLTLTYTHGSLQLEASVTIATYPKLRPIDPEEVAVVTLGSSKTVLFEGGPAPWVLDPSKYHRNLLPEQPANVRIQLMVTSTRTQHTYHVLCLKLGQQLLVFNVGNGPTDKNELPADETVSIRFICALPTSVTVRPLAKEMTDCPLLHEGNIDTQFPVLNSKLLSLEVLVFDNERRQFDNFSSLQWVWSSSNMNLLRLGAPPTPPLSHYGNRAIMEVPLVDKTGPVTVMISSDSHQSHVLNNAGISFKDPFSPPVKSTLSLLLRSPPVLSPHTALVYNHPNNRLGVAILHGSSYFSVDHIIKPRPPVADVEYIKETQIINIHPLGEGRVQLIVQDICLPVDPISGIIHIATIQYIHIKVPDKVQVGNTIIAYVRLLDGRKEPFPSNQHWLMKLQPNLKTDNIELNTAPDSLIATLPESDTKFSSVFVIKGVTMGTAILLFNATSTTGKIIQSHPAEIQVFDALHLDPTNITLVPTATYQISSTGGPHLQTSIVYSIDKGNIASVDQTGLITALVPGHATVTGKAQSTDIVPPYIYSTDTVNVRVVLLRGIKIVIPSTKLLTGEQISVYVEGKGDDETPFTFASAVPGLTFYWTVSNMDVISLSSVYEKAGISLQNEKDFAARLRTRNPGQGVIRVTVRCPPGICEPNEATFTDEVTVIVIAKLRLINPADGHLFLPQNGRAKIITNKDGVCDISYDLLLGGDEGLINNNNNNDVISSSQSLVSLSSSGHVTAAGFNGHTVVMVTAYERDFRLNQSLIVHVEVRPMDSLSLVSLSSAKATQHSKQHAFPLGYSAHFLVHLHDSVGRLFDYANVEFDYRMNRFDIAHVTRSHGNDTYIVKAARQGSVILKVWVKEFPSISDYIRVTVGYAIIPSLATVHLGAKICFTTHLTEDNHGTWETSGRGVLDMTQASGVAKAIGTGRTVVYHKVDDIVDTHTEISIATIQQVVFNMSSKLQTFTNSLRPEEIGPYLILVEFKDEHNLTDFTLLQVSPSNDCLNKTKKTKRPKTSDPLYLQQVNFECILELSSGNGNIIPVSNFITSRSYFDKLTGASYCELLPSPSSKDYTTHSRTLSVMAHLALSLRVKASDFDNTYEVFSDWLSVPFLPAFTLDDDNVTLTSIEHTLTITVSGLPTVLQSIQVSSPHPLSITQSSIKGTTATYLLSLSETPPTHNISELRLPFTSSLTYQKTILYVSYIVIEPILDASSCPVVQNESNLTQAEVNMLQHIYRQWNLVFILVALLVIVLATIVICIALRQTSHKAPSGFTAHLPPATPAFTPTQATPISKGHTHMATPLWSQQQRQSAFKQTGSMSRYPSISPNRSPQFSAFSQ